MTSAISSSPMSSTPGPGMPALPSIRSCNRLHSTLPARYSDRQHRVARRAEGREHVSDLLERVAGAPITWGVDGSPGWGIEHDAGAFAEHTIGRGPARPLRPVPHRLPARRRRPHGALQLALRAPPRRHVRAAHRGHRRRALVGRHGHGHPRRPALARPRLGRRARTSAGRTRRTSSRSGSTATARRRARLVEDGHAYYCYCSPERLREERETRRGARRGVAVRPRLPGARRPSASPQLEADRRAAAPSASRCRQARTAFDDAVHGAIEFDTRQHRGLRRSCDRTAIRPITSRWSWTTWTWGSRT